MKKYIKESLDKINEILEEHPDADLRVGVRTLIGCKVTADNIQYAEDMNAIIIQSY